MNKNTAIEMAAQIWCRPTTQQIEMDTRLAEQFAITLKEECDNREQALEAAWNIICNVSGGDWQKQSAEWQTAAEAMRSRYHAVMPSHHKSQNTDLILFFDTETNGLPDFNKRARDPSQPHIVQLAAVLTDFAGNVIETYNVICKPDGWEITQELSDIHGITHAHALSVGMPESEACAVLLDMIRRAKLVCAFNIMFDKFIARIGMRRFDLMSDEDDAWWKSMPTFCAMHPMTNLCRLPFQNGRPGRGGAFKFPKLQEAYQHAFGETFDKAHDALADITATIRLYLWICEKFSIQPGTPAAR